MIIETNLVDLSKVKLEDPSTWNEHLKYEIPKQWGVKKKRAIKKSKTEEERKIALKIYQHKYYLEVTKPKRKNRRNNE